MRGARRQLKGTMRGARRQLKGTPRGARRQLKGTLTSTQPWPVSAYLWGSGWMSSRTQTLCLTSASRTSSTRVCRSLLRPSWTAVQWANIASERTRRPASCSTPRTFQSTRSGSKGESVCHGVVYFLSFQCSCISAGVKWCTWCWLFCLLLRTFPCAGASNILLSTCYSFLQTFLCKICCTDAIFTGPLSSSFWILSFFVTPLIHLRIFISFTSRLLSCLLLSP